jgi:hypothetical protein
VTDWTGGPEREWYDEQRKDLEHDAASCPFGHIDGVCAGDAFGLASGRIPHIESFLAPEPPEQPPSER